MLKKFIVIGLLTALVATTLFMGGCGQKEDDPQNGTQKEVRTEPQTLNLFAAAGLKKPMDVVIEKYKEETGNDVAVNYGSSGELFSQIKAGQPCDLYFNADILYNQKLEEEGLLEEEANFLNDNIVLAVSESAADKIKSIEDLKQDGVTIAICDPQAPVGVYAENSLKSLGVWNDVEKNIVARPSTINQAAIMVSEDQVDATLIFSSVVKANNLPIVQTVDQKDSGEIIFAIGIIKDQNTKLAKEFMKFAQKNVAEFEQYGWTAYEAQ